MPDLRPSSRRVAADRLIAVGGSLALHGIAVAAVITSLAGGAVEESPAPPAMTMTMEWAAATNDAAGQSSATAAAPSESAASTADASPSMSKPVIKTAEPSVVEIAATAPEAATTETAANTVIEAPEITPPPARAPKAVVSAKAQSTPARQRDESAEHRPRPPSTTVAKSDSARGDGTSERAMTDATTGTVSDATSAAPARPSGARTAWSVTSRTPPAYPMSARRRGIEGEVELRVDVDSDGRPQLVTIARSSGDRQLDSAAARAVEQWRFAVAAPMAIEIPVQFRLNAGDLAASQP